VSGDRCWQLPLWKVYGEQIKTAMADVRNTGGRRAGAITAGLFLKEFVGEVPWVHLDIAELPMPTVTRPTVAPYNPSQVRRESVCGYCGISARPGRTPRSQRPRILCRRIGLNTAAPIAARMVDAGFALVYLRLLGRTDVGAYQFVCLHDVSGHAD